MPALHQKLRKQLEKTVISARDIAEEAAREALKRLAVDQPKLFGHMTPDERELRNKLRAKARQLGDRRDKAGKQAIDHLVTECAYEHWHRMLFARFLAENDLLIHDEEGVPVSLEECEELAKDEGIDGWTLAARFASRMLPQIFRPDDPALAVTLAPESKRALERMLDTLPPEVFTADDSLGWVYQFWQTKRKDEVNKSGNKIGADELPAVTQLFTEHYMVLFLLHNTLGAWWAGKKLTAKDAASAKGEDELRRKLALPGVGWEYLRFVRGADGEGGPWRPAAGAFDAWPKTAAELKVLDPCCGSGHFLVAALHHLVPIRMAEEGRSAAEAIDAVLRDNLHGLEIDERCCQIAAFALALAVWRFPQAGGYRELPELHIACSGIGPQASEEQWLKLAEQSGIPMPAVGKQPIREGLRNLHALFSQAPTLGSLISPAELPADLIAADYETIQPYLAAILKAEKADDEIRERAVAAAGMVKAADLLAGGYTLVITNVPYLGRKSHDSILINFIDKHHKPARKDIATVFIDRGWDWLSAHGTIAVVTRENWLFLTGYRQLRETYLKRRTWNLVARLGPGAFEAISGHVVKSALVILSSGSPRPSAVLAGLEASGASSPQEKAAVLRGEVLVASDCGRTATPTHLAKHTTARKDSDDDEGDEEPIGQADRVVRLIEQAKQLKHPDARVILEDRADFELLATYANSWQGIKTSDDPRFAQQVWEQGAIENGWWRYQRTPEHSAPHTGRSEIIFWEDGHGLLTEVCQKGASFRGASGWERLGVAVHTMGDLGVTLYTGEKFSADVSILDPKDPELLPVLWTLCQSPEYVAEVRKIDRALRVTNTALVKVPFDLAHWQKVAAEKYPDGLPEPESDDATQWLFHGRPEESTAPLQVAVARLLGYRWPAELDDTMRLSRRARGLVRRCEELLRFADDDGIVCIPAVRGEQTAADRVRAVLAAAHSDAWSPAKQEELLASVGYGGKSLDEWLRNGFFEQHYKLFHQRPFIWHIWDGRKNDGFGALVNYHMLDAKLLDRLIYTYLGDWIKRQEQAVAQGESGADARLLAAQQLQEKLKLIAEGQPPYDIFVRWKPIEQQPIGWNPDINDGVRMNIRPFMEANILRKKPNIKWGKDRGKEPQRPQEQYPWFYDEMGEFTGNRVNDVHLTNTEKLEARSPSQVGHQQHLERSH